MGKTDKRTDTYIAKTGDFAQPILKHLRDLIHKACPDVVETIKWGMPYFDYHGIMCTMAAFKQHCAFGFWKASVMSDPHNLLSKVGETSMGHFGQIRKLKDLPSDKILIEYIKEAAALNKAGVKLPAKPKATEKKEFQIPNYFSQALAKNKKALKTFENFNNTNKKEYVEWVTGAKNDETRNKRLATSIEWMSEGKIRHWKYVRKN